MIAGRFLTLFASTALFAMGAASAQTPTKSVKDAPVAPPSIVEPPVSTAPAGAAELTAGDLSAYLDGLLPAAMAVGDIAGATVVVVKDDRVLLSKAYGYSDMAKRTPVIADRTMFRPGSVSKLFAWTAIMQLVEAGKIDLDADVNKYLDFKVAGYEGKPITVRNLMTHTPGLEERLKDLLVMDEKQMTSLEQTIKAGTPAALFPPGAVPAYSNFGAALGGYIVQRVSGIPFEAYIEQKIFGPLGMHSSTFRQPVQESLRAQVSNGYLQASRDPIGYEFCPESPAGALAATGADMGNFMLAHLNGGVLPAAGESSRILRAETVDKMHAVANVVAPGIDAMALGFYEQNRNGVRTIAHGGDTTVFHSDLLLIPSARVGLFLSFNSVGRNRAAYSLRSALTDGFMDRYFPRAAALPAVTPPAGSRERAEQVAGSLYELSRRAESNLFSVVYTMGQSGAHVDEHGHLLFDALTAPNDQPREFEEVKPWFWREMHGQMGLAALLTPDGKVRAMVPDGYGAVFVFQPVPGWRSKGWLLPTGLTAAVIVTIASIIWPVGAVRRAWRRRRLARAEPTHVKPVVAAGRPDVGTAAADSLAVARNASQRSAGASRWPLASRLASVASFLFALLIAIIVLMFSGDSLWILTSPATPFIRLVQLTALLATLGAIASVIAAIWSWRNAERRWHSIGRTLVALSCLVFAYVALVFHFLSPGLNY